MNDSKEKLLITDDDPNIVKILRDRMHAKGFQVITAYDGQECLNILSEEAPPILLLDLKMPKMTGIEVLQEIKKRNIEIATIVLTAYGTIEKAVEAIKEGAFDFIQKPIDTEHLDIVINKVVEKINLKKKSILLQSKLQQREEELYHLKKETGIEYDFSRIIGKNQELQNVLNMVRKVANQKSTIFINGESGTGKELLAQAIHYNSNRKNNNFIAVNCGAIPSQLLEREFFGHMKGSFTDAHETTKGFFEQANGGTLFLDEIGELSLDLQVKLLRAIENEEIIKIGASHPLKVDVRLITATNKDLLELVKEGLFRKDLFYRIYVIPLTLPSLRNCKKDIPLLIDHFLKKLSKKTGQGIPKFTDEALTVLMNYSYPGNIRELENLIERVFFLTDILIIGPDDLPRELREDYCEKQGAANLSPNNVSSKETLQEAKVSAEKQIILEALKACNYNIADGAKLLKISRSNLYYKIKKYNILI